MEGLILGFMFWMGVQASGGDVAPVPYHLSDACKVQHVTPPGTNISYDTYEGCLKQ